MSDKKYMYRVRYYRAMAGGAIQKKEVVKRTAKQVVFLTESFSSSDTKKFHERREALESEGVRWFESFSEVKKWTEDFILNKIKSTKERLEEWEDSLEKLNNLVELEVDKEKLNNLEPEVDKEVDKG